MTAVPITEDAIRDALAAALQTIAPDASIGGVDRAADYRAELGLDSFDFLRLMQALYERLGVDIPEDAYAQVVTIDGLRDFVEAAAQQSPLSNR